MNLIPHHILQVGDLKFDPSHGCKKQCYTGLSTERNSKDSSSITQLQLLLFTYFPKSHQTKSKVPTFLGKSCWTARLAIPIHTNPLNILRFKLSPNFIFECFKPQTCSFYFWYSQNPNYVI